MAYPLIYYFSSPYCAPCKNVERMLTEINVSLFGNKLRIKKIDILTDIAVAKKFNVISVPTIVIGSIRLSLIIDKNELTDAILQGFISSVSFEDSEDFATEEQLMTANTFETDQAIKGESGPKSEEVGDLNGEAIKPKSEKSSDNSSLNAKQNPKEESAPLNTSEITHTN